MTWTTARPTKAGLYWYRGDDNQPMVCKVEEIFRDCWWATFLDDPEGESLDRLQGEWQGPIEPDE